MTIEKKNHRYGCLRDLSLKFVIDLYESRWGLIRLIMAGLSLWIVILNRIEILEIPDTSNLSYLKMTDKSSL